MTWVKVDDRMPENGKVAGLHDRAFRAYIEGLCYCGGNLTDGLIPESVAKVRGWRRSANELVTAGLWEAVSGGWRVHDYTTYQRTRAGAARISEVRSEAGSRGGKATANGKQIASDVRKQNASRSEAEVEKRSDPPVAPQANPEPPSVMQRLWAVYTELAGRLNVPVTEEHQFEAWVDADCTLAMVEQARTDTLEWGPEKPWAAFRAKLGELVAASKITPFVAPEPVHLTASEVAALRGGAS